MQEKNYIEQISLYLDDQLGTQEREDFEQRLATDSALRAELAAQRRIKNYLQHLPKVEILNDNFKSHLLNRALREVIPPKRNYRLNYATVALALVFVSFLLGGGVFAVTSFVDWLNSAERFIVDEESSVSSGRLASGESKRGIEATHQSLTANVTRRIRFDVVGVSPEDFFSRALASYARGEVKRDIIAPFFTQTHVFEGAVVDPPTGGILTSKQHWLRYGKGLPTVVRVVVPTSQLDAFLDFLHRQEGTELAPEAVKPSVRLVAPGIEGDSGNALIEIKFKSFQG